MADDQILWVTDENENEFGEKISPAAARSDNLGSITEEEEAAASRSLNPSPSLDDDAAADDSLMMEGLPEANDESSHLKAEVMASLAEEEEQLLRVKEDRYLRISVIVLAGSMFCNFGMFAPVQNIITTVFPGSATISLILVYGFFTLGTTLAPSVVRFLTAPNGLLLGCLGYLSYTLGCFANNIGLFLFTSFVIGLCASIIWTSNGAVLTALSTPSNRGLHSSIVIGCVRMAAVFSNLLTGVLLNYTNADGTTAFSNSTIFFILFLVGSCGCLGFVFLRFRMKKVKEIFARREDYEQRKAVAKAVALHHLPYSPPIIVANPPLSITQRLIEIFHLIASKDYRHLFPVLLLTQGCGNGFFFGSFGVTMGRSYLGYAQAVMGCTAVFFIVNLGRLLDRVPLKYTSRKKWVLYGTMTAHIVFYIMAAVTTFCSAGFTSREPQASAPRVVSKGFFSFLVFTTSICFGMAWSGSDISNYYHIGMIFAKHSETAFAAKAFSESLGFVIAQLLMYVIPINLYPLFAAAWTLPVMWWYYKWDFPTEMVHSKSIPLEQQQKQQQEQVQQAAADSMPAEAMPMQPMALSSNLIDTPSSDEHDAEAAAMDAHGAIAAVQGMNISGPVASSSSSTAC